MKFKEVQIQQGFKYNGIYYLKISDNEARESITYKKTNFLGTEICNI